MRSTTATGTTWSRWIAISATGPEHIARLLTELRSANAKIVIASPYAKNGQTTNIPFLRRFLSRSANRFLAATAKGQLSTLTGMVRAYDRRFLSTLT